MKRETELALIERLLGHLAAKSTDVGDENYLAPATDYVDVNVFEREWQRVFRQRWVALIAAAEIPSPGDFRTLGLGSLSLLIVRGEDGRARVFHNVCRHRGTRVTDAERGCAKSFVCPYHAWTYGRDGSLLGVPHRERGFPTLELAKRGLTPVNTREHAGLVWVRLEPGTVQEPTLSATATAEIEAALTRRHIVSRRTIYRDCNWKILIEGALEAYHIKKAHAGTIYPLFRDNLCLADDLGDGNQRVVMPKRSLAGLADEARDTWALLPHGNLVYLVFPSLLVLALEDHTNVMTVIPESPSRSRIDSIMLVDDPPADAHKARYWEKNAELTYTTLDEDFALGESIQAGLRSGANTELLFATMEHGLTRFHRQVNALRDE